MSFIVKNQRNVRLNESRLRSYAHTRTATGIALPQTAATAYFNVNFGLVLVHLLFGRVTTVIQTQANNVKVTLNPTTGTSADVASNLDTSADEVGTVYIVEGDGTALIGVNAGQTWAGAGLPHPFLVNAGTIDIETSASNTGNWTWHCFWEPIDDDATVTAAV